MRHGRRRPPKQPSMPQCPPHRNQIVSQWERTKLSCMTPSASTAIYPAAYIHWREIKKELDNPISRI